MGFVLGKCGCNAMNALACRHGVEPPAPLLDWFHANRYVDALIKDHPWSFGTLAPDDFWSWMDRWPRAKRLAILLSMARDTVCPSRLLAMIKRENNHSWPTKARLIQYYYNMATQAAYGSQFVALQKALFAWAPEHPYEGVRVTFGSGMNNGDLGDWMTRVHDRFARPFFYERDGKNWDATMQRFHHDLKMRLYRVYDPGFAKFVDDGFACLADCRLPNGLFRYRIVGTVKSGHNDTTLGNSLINACIAIEACVRLGLQAEVLVVGDDLLVATELDPSGLSDIERGYGINPEARVFRSYLDVSFISGCWLRAGAGHIFVPKLGRLLARLWWTTSPPSKKQLRNYRHSVVAGLRAVLGRVPLYDEFLRAPTGAAMPMSKDYEMWVSSFGGPTPTSETEIDLMNKYHFNPSQMAEVRAYLAGLSCEPKLIVHPLLDQIMLTDLSDLHDRPVAI
jgi:hypothetical protein